MHCVKEMVDTIPDAFWHKENIKVLDSCCGNGNFHAYIQTKTSLHNLYFNEINPKRLRNAKDIFGEDIHLTSLDFLDFPKKEEYDLVVSNPPYAKFNQGKRVSKNHNLSRDFIKRALEITKKDGFILFIVPNNWMSFSDRNQLPTLLSQYQFIHLNINGAKKWFPKVGSSFTWFLLKKSLNTSSFTVHNHYLATDQQQVKIKPKQNFIPLYLSQQVIDLFDKTVNNPKLPKFNIETTSNLHRYTQSH